MKVGEKEKEKKKLTDIGFGFFWIFGRSVFRFDIG